MSLCCPSLGADRCDGRRLKVFAPFTATGLLATLFIPETNQLTLEELSNEQQEGFIRGKCLALMVLPMLMPPIGLAPQGSRPS